MFPLLAILWRKPPVILVNSNNNVQMFGFRKLFNGLKYAMSANCVLSFVKPGSMILNGGGSTFVRLEYTWERL